ncbi:MAG: tyrosine-protein phosphatase [Chloroflexota bacterium]|nr:tyrosine-protein phosphatase [Chloroflexota bacterium]
MTNERFELASQGRRLAWDACYNAREVGGYPTSNGGTVAWGRLVRTDNLSRLTPAGQAALIEYGVSTIIDLRDPSELAMEPHAFMQAAREAGAVSYHNLPLMIFDDTIWLKTIKEIDTTPGYYCATLDYFKPQVAAILQTVADAGVGGVLVHCHAGKDRTGLVVALLLGVAGVAPALIAEDYAVSNQYLQPWYARMLAKHADNPARQQRMAADFKSSPEFIMQVFAHLDQAYGGVNAYLLATGLTQAEIDQIHNRLHH